jgi:hypothetical protein
MRSLLLIVILSVFIGCDSEGNIPNTTSDLPKNTIVYDRFLPMRIGNYWAYSYTDYVYDTSFMVRIIDTTRVESRLYYMFEEKYLDPSDKHTDTSYYRFAGKDSLHKIIKDTDVFYIDFVTSTGSIGGTYYPGMVWDLSYRDSTFIGDFDSCRSIIFRSVEPTFEHYAPNIGRLRTIGFGNHNSLIGAKVNDSVISWKK